MNDLKNQIPFSWQKILEEEIKQPYFKELSKFLGEERGKKNIFPPENQVFSAFEATSYENLKIFLLGQDPYHGEGQAHGLAFSVLGGVKKPPSLVNILKELHHDLGCSIPDHGCLTSWAKQGVMLLNTVLTVRAHQANSHKKKGWEQFTDGVIQKINERKDPVIFILWGNSAKKKIKWIETNRHHIIQSAHPSPLSVRHGFWNSSPFSKANELLKQMEKSEINWQIPPSLSL